MREKLLALSKEEVLKQILEEQVKVLPNAKKRKAAKKTKTDVNEVLEVDLEQYVLPVEKDLEQQIKGLHFERTFAKEA